MKFGEKLKQARAAAGLTQAQLAEKVGIHRISEARLEAGDVNPSWDLVQKLADALGIGCEDLRDDPPPKRKRPGT
jgi:DNA-binding XRE family transcriptional regulator